MPTTTITAYHGSCDGHEDPKWFTTDRSHAQCFGPARTYSITFDSALEIDADEHEVLAAGGWAADEALASMLAESGADVAIVSHWEGSGLCILTTRWATIEPQD